MYKYLVWISFVLTLSFGFITVINVWTPEKLNSKRAARKNQQGQNAGGTKSGPPVEPYPNDNQKVQLRMQHEQLQRQQFTQQQFLQQRQQQMQAQHLYFNNGFHPPRPQLLPNPHHHPMPGGDNRFGPMALQQHHNNLSNPLLNCYAGSDASLDSIPGSSISGPARVSCKKNT